MTRARYDGIAEWYDRTFAHIGDVDRESSPAALLARLLGPGEGWCLDVGCGTGLHFAALRDTGRRVVGVDLSADQLRLVRQRQAPVVHGDAYRLPFASESVSAAICSHVHTDVDDVRPVFAEVARVLRPYGTFVYVGAHPCFWGHFVERAEGQRIVYPGYWDEGWHLESPYWSKEGIRGRLGEHHITLGALVTAVLAAGLRLTVVEETDRSQPFADRIGLVAMKA